MRKVKLQINISLDGIISLQDMHSLWDEELRDFSIENLQETDSILLGSRTAPELITAWAEIAKDSKHQDQALGKRITEIPKVVFSNSLKRAPWPNASIVSGPLREEIERLKAKPGKDMLIYGSAKLVSSLAKENLIDEYDLLVNPLAAGQGIGIFDELQDTLRLELLESKQFSCGVVLLRYRATPANL